MLFFLSYIILKSSNYLEFLVSLCHLVVIGHLVDMKKKTVNNCKPLIPCLQPSRNLA